MAALFADHIANNVRAERARRRWRQADLAAALGWSEDMVGDLETGRRAVSANDLPQLCRALGVPLFKLAEGAPLEDLAALGIE